MQWARIHTMIGLNDRQLFEKLILVNNNTLYELAIVTLLLASRNLSHTLAVKANASMRINAVSPKPSLLANTK